MLKNLRRKAPEKDKLGHDLFKLAKVNVCFLLFKPFLVLVFYHDTLLQNKDFSNESKH